MKKLRLGEKERNLPNDTKLLSGRFMICAHSDSRNHILNHHFTLIDWHGEVVLNTPLSSQMCLFSSWTGNPVLLLVAFLSSTVL